MKNIFTIGSFVLWFLVIRLVIFLVTFPIIKDYKKYKKLDNDAKDKLKTIIYIFSAPVILFFLDYYNVFSIIFPKYSNLSREYDWLSFIGTYAGAIVSAILLIFITEKDRDENTAVLRASQRPYLEVSYVIIKPSIMKDNKKNATFFEHGSPVDKLPKKKEWLALCIKNTGASVAILDTNKTKIKIRYKSNDVVEEEQKLSFSINRLSIGSGEEVYIKFLNNNLYKNGKLLSDSRIRSSSVYYKDLFNKNYYDECVLKETLEVIHDNEEL